MLTLYSCQGGKPADSCQKVGICPKSFGEATVDGKTVKLYTLTNKNGVTAQFTNIGAKMVSLYVPDRNGKLADVVQGYATAAEYAACDNATGKGEPFFGATIGRYGNRIAEGKFSIDGTEYTVDQNEGTNSLHGGHKGFYAVVWDANQEGDQKITFKYTSPDGEMGFPGNLATAVTYELTDTNSVVISYTATTDKPTVVNLTNHSFFNLNGDDDESINDEVLRIAADEITPVDDKLIPTGEMMSVEGTPFDFRTSHLISDSLESQHPQLLLGQGYDHNFVLSDCIGENGVRFAAQVNDPQSGRIMRVYTSEPGVQFYAGNFLNGTQKGKCGKMYPRRSALCLETQHYPNTPNTPAFPQCQLNPGETYSHICIYSFSVEK
ncbi:MAG: galactose mutarotase [Bacteroidales bacterium]|nr:galactose mutarotase [Bacteroidales bacterium]